MWHGGMTVIGAIINSLLHSVGEKWVSMGNSGMTVIGAFRNSLLYSLGDK
jgi:hypothetical protein